MKAHIKYGISNIAANTEYCRVANISKKVVMATIAVSRKAKSSLFAVNSKKLNA